MTMELEILRLIVVLACVSCMTVAVLISFEIIKVKKEKAKGKIVSIRRSKYDLSNEIDKKRFIQDVLDDDDN